MTFRVTRNFTKAEDKQWMKDGNPGLYDQLSAAIGTLSTFPGFISRTMVTNNSNMQIITDCNSEADYDAYTAAKLAIIEPFRAQHDAFTLENSIAEQPEVRETV